MAKRKTKTKISKEIKKRKITALVIGIILFIIALLINKTTIIRLLLSIISITSITIAICYSEKKIQQFIPLIVISLLLVSIATDTIISLTLKRFPIYSYNIITNKNTRVYNAIGIRVWQCDLDSNKLIVTPFYSNGFTCDPEDMEAVDSNSFLQSIESNYNEYKNNYVKIKGKISKISGSNIVEMQPYIETDITVNGHVEFSTNITLRVILDNQDELDKYDIYDEITIVGIVKNMETSDNLTYVYMYEGKVVSDIDLDEYEITVVPEKECSEPTLIFTDGYNNTYSYCVNDVMIAYNDDNTYELSAALSSGKIDISSIKDNMTEKDSSDGITLYTSKTFNMINCDNNYIIGDTKLTLKNDVCSLIK